GDRPSRRAFIAMPIALFGLSLALDVAGLARPAAGTTPVDTAATTIGVAFALSAAASFALALYLTTRWLGSTDGRLRTLVLMVVVTAVAIAGGAPGGRLDWPPDGIGWLAALPPTRTEAR